MHHRATFARPLVSILALLFGLVITTANPFAASADTDGDPAEAGTSASTLEDASDTEVAEPEQPPIVRSAERLAAQMTTLVEEFQDLQSQADGAAGEDRLVLEKQIVDAKLEYLDLVGRLVENLLQQEEQGLHSDELRKTTVDATISLTPAVVRHIDASEALITKIRRGRDSAEIGELHAIEQRIEKEIIWLDKLYRAYVDNVKHLEALELEAAPARDDLVDRLNARVDLQSGRIDLTMEQLKEVGERQVDRPDDVAISTEAAVLEARRKVITASLNRLVREMTELDIDATEYQQLLITSTGEVTYDIFKPEVAIGLIQEWIGSIRNWGRENGAGLVFKVLFFLLIIALAWVASGLTRRLLRRAFGAAHMQASTLLQTMLIGAISNGVLLLGVLIALSQLGLELAPLLAGLGIAGFIVGFALQDSLANFAAGMMILGYRPFDTGDVIDAAGVRGTVNQMSLVNTTILTLDNRTLIVPNNKIWGDVITNLTHQEIRRVDLEVRIPYSEDLKRVEAVLARTFETDDRILSNPEPVVKLNELGESAMHFLVRPWVKTDDYWDVYWDMTRSIKLALDAEGIRIAVPERAVHIQSNSSDLEA